jgi:hypothetical protein
MPLLTQAQSFRRIPELARLATEARAALAAPVEQVALVELVEPVAGVVGVVGVVRGGVNWNFSTGGAFGNGGAFGAGGAGGMPGACFWWPPYFYWLVCPSCYWHYWDFGIYPGYGWEQPWFDDSMWRIGLAPFGYGEGNETTTINSTNQYKTAYFRQQFVVTNMYNVTNLTLTLRRDDGVIVYLNGIEGAAKQHAHRPCDKQHTGAFDRARRRQPCIHGVALAVSVA